MLASCGKEVKIHEWPDGTLIGGVSSINGVTFKGLSWSYPGNKLLAVPSGHCPILLQECNNEEAAEDVFWADVLKSLDGGIEAGIFPNTVENCLTVGLATGQLMGYDICNQRPVKHYACLPEPVVLMDYTFDDTLLAAGCRNGQIYFYDGSGKINTSVSVPLSNTVSAMMFHPHSDSYLVAGSKEGVLVVWDVNTAAIKFQSHHHEGAVSGISMAAHEELLISVSVDKKVLFYDLRTHLLINSLNFGIELTAIAYSKANEDIVVGTSEGRVMCFDRRKPSVLTYSFESQKNAPVKCLCFNLRSSADPKGAEDLVSSTTAPKNDTSPSLTAILKLGDFAKSDVSVLSRMHAGMDGGMGAGGSKLLEEGAPPGEGGGVPLYQVIEENSLRALKQEIINTNREIMRKFMEDINDQFLKIRMEVSREFCHLEQIQNQKWKEFHNKLSKLAAVERKEHRTVSESQISEGSESYRAESFRFEGPKMEDFERNN